MARAVNRCQSWEGPGNCHQRPSGDDSVRSALVWTLGKGLGPDFTPEVEGAWGDAYDFLASVMKDAAGSQSASTGSVVGKRN
jgi:hemoglobin-like flavoprotein